MKARVKATGEIIEVVKDGPFYNAIDGYERYYEHELDFQDVISYWTRLEHQAAIVAMQGFLAGRMEDTYNRVAEFSINQAHALVQKLKEKEERK